MSESLCIYGCHNNEIYKKNNNKNKNFVLGMKHQGQPIPISVPLTLSLYYSPFERYVRFCILENGTGSGSPARGRRGTFSTSKIGRALVVSSYCSMDIFVVTVTVRKLLSILYVGKMDRKVVRPLVGVAEHF
jgi:hypothetical protein